MSAAHNSSNTGQAGVGKTGTSRVNGRVIGAGMSLA